MVIESTIRAYQKVLRSFRLSKPATFSEDFAQKRFLKKLQEPDLDITAQLSNACWEDWISNDNDLPNLRNQTLLSEWYIVRENLHKALSNFSEGNFSFPKGSEFDPTRGHNSLEARLCASSWTTTYDNFEAFSKLCYNHRGLRTSAKQRYNNWYNAQGFDISRRKSNRLLYGHFSSISGDVGYNIFRWKLERIVVFTHGSRFSSVPKNNDNRRPINVEPFANILTQSSIGKGIRSVLHDHFNVDLDTLQDVHRRRISDMNIATIDLKNASDNISLDLCRFLLPKRFFTKLDLARSNFVLGADGEYHQTKKISSMGNGFTFELMSLILTALCRVLDPDSSVYGDDIIISRSCSHRLIALLHSVGLKVNVDKSFVDGPFRESCGGNFHKEEGYIESFDFLWPENIHACMMTLNKCFRLRKYPSFRILYQCLVRATPSALQGGPCERFSSLDHFDLIGRSTMDAESLVVFPPFFVTPKIRSDIRMSGKHRESLIRLCYDPSKYRVIRCFEWHSRDRSPQLKHLPSHRWAKYFMYLSSGRRAKDVVTGQGHWKEFFVASCGAEYFRLSTLKT